MATLPNAYSQSVSLAAVLASCFAAVERGAPQLPLAPVDAAVVVLADGLGALPLKARAGHARTIAPRLNRATTIESGFPTTTAAALATLCTGVFPGQHGITAYEAVDPEADRVFNHLSGWKTGPDPATWQRVPTLFETHAATGIRSYLVGQARYADTRLTQAVHRGAEYVPAKSIAERMSAAISLARAGRAVVFVYVPELDMAAHQYGWQSPEWTAALEELDAGMAQLERGLGKAQGALLTADHGMVDIADSGKLFFDREAELIEGVRHVAGDYRCVQLHLEPGATAGDLERLAQVWHEAEDDRAWVATRDEAIAAGWFGPSGVADEVLPRIGELLIAARSQVVYYDTRSTNAGNWSMVGQHGSFSPDEVRVPLIGFGAFA
ncbi:alkaline phosphatase family protein [Gryllotalpicola protaetiae]|uniref:Alkaline phosphatase family protein n=1 Tax=Gryllotalpicola protaetiae TaxID=2419771 RepID=A0A387BQQ7_9MICO|nr:alkaline phosphatase family protein [Gryllotalpicola protaetiae]AYG05008.1 alkaline phosphatase family protein [Gryllotalpicola protaetiae]